MIDIKNVLLCGLGAVGCVCATRIQDSNLSNLKILVDSERFKRYSEEPTTFNSKEYNFDYVLPTNTDFKADLIIIATKDDGLKSAIKNIKNFITNETIIISVLNGIHSENEITKIYHRNKILISFYIGNSCIREGRRIIQDDNYEFIIGDKDNTNSEQLKILSNFFIATGIKHKVSSHINERYWKKFMVNVGLNQLCAVYNMSFKEIKQNPIFIKELKELIWEVKLIAEKENVNNPQKLYDDTINFLIKDFKDANPSMLQDIRAGRKTEVDIFSGEVIKLAKKHRIQTPVNKKIYNKIKQIEENSSKPITN